MGKRFAILIGAAALGAALMAVGASADFRSVGDPRGDITCEHKRGHYCSPSLRRSADIVRATAGHDGTRLRHTIRVVGKFKRAELDISTDLDRACEWSLDIKRGHGRSKFENCDVSGVRTGRARMDFHHHSVKILFSKRSIGNPQSYGWMADAQVGRLPNASDHNGVPDRGGYIRHRLGQTAAALASQTVKINSRVTLKIRCAHHIGGGCNKDLFHGRVNSRKHACVVHRTVKLFDRQRGPDGPRGKDKTSYRGKWRLVRPAQPGFFYAKVLRREVRTAGTTFVCRGDRTRVHDFH
jgi:hypothetical protein